MFLFHDISGFLAFNLPEVDLILFNNNLNIYIVLKSCQYTKNKYAMLIFKNF
jgi:hypothetical protein